MLNSSQQARINLEAWSRRKRHPGESWMWRRFNPRISTIQDLPYFRQQNALGNGLRLGLDDTRIEQGPETERVFDELVAKWGLPSVLPLLESKVGHPPLTFVGNSSQKALHTDLHDLFLTNFALDFQQAILGVGLTQPTLFLEIGGGYGGTVAKLARLFPSTRFILADLPPASLLQTYYLEQLYPEEVSVIPLGNSSRSSKMTSRFTICSPTELKTILRSLDGVINTRSFQEMRRPTVRKYFDLIQSSLKPGGIFMNVNSKAKLGYRFTDLPYDNYWELFRSEAAFNQPHIWSLTTRRLRNRNAAFSSWKLDVPMPPAPSLRRRTKALVTRHLITLRRVLGAGE